MDGSAYGKAFEGFFLVILGIIVTLIVAVFVVGYASCNAGREQGRKMELYDQAAAECRAKGGALVDGKCMRVTQEPL